MAIEQIISIAKAKHDSLLSNEFISTVKSVIGTCQALGVLIESKDPKEVMEEIREGKYASEINAKKTEVDPEKKKELDSFFATIAEKQDALRKAEEAEQAAAEEKKAAAAAKAPAPAAPAKK